MGQNADGYQYDPVNESAAENVGHAESANSRPSVEEGVGTTRAPLRKAAVDDLAGILEKQSVIFDDIGAGFCLEGFAYRIYMRPGLGPKLFWYGMCLGGYCSPCRCAKMVYMVLWVCAFILCGGSCFWNLVKREVPYHLLAVDAMMALVHVPGLFSIIFWHSCFEVQEEHESPQDWLLELYKKIPGKEMWQVHTFVTSHGSLCLKCGGCSSTCRHNTVDDHLNAVLSALGLVLIPAQTALTALVYVGYALPALDHMMADQSVHGSYGFAKFHSWVMCFAIPPVVACIVTSGALISYFIYLHILEADIVSWLIQAKAREELRNVADRSRNVRMIKWGERNFYVGNADIESEKYANEVVSFLVEIFMHVQDRVDTSCRLWSAVVTQFLIVAFLELLSAVYDFSLMVGGDVTYTLTPAILCVDLFLLVSGIIGTTAFLLLGAALTKRLDDLVVDVVIGLRSRGVPPHISFSLYGFLETAGRKSGIGFKVFGLRVTYSHVVTYFSVLSTLLGYGIAHAEYILDIETSSAKLSIPWS